MNAEIKVFGYLVPFFLVVTAIYAVVTDFGEWVGIMGLGLTMLMCLFVSGYLAMTARKLDPRPEDDLEGESWQQAGEYGHFAPYSWWPLWLGLTVSIATMSLGIGWWLLICAAPFLLLSIVGWTFEFFRGAKAV